MNKGIKNWLRQKADFICRKLEKSILNKSLKCKVVFGPVRSRRLGLVLGINNINKQNACSYNCIYCPSGKKTCFSVCTNYCLSPYELHLSVRKKLEELKKNNKKIDYLVFAGSGEPSLDSSLAQEITLLREFGYKIAVFTNSSLLWNDDVRQNLMYADYVSVKVDTANEDTWMKLNRPHRKLDFNLILDGIKQFSKDFNGTLVTETTLIKNLNDSDEEILGLSNYLNTIKLDKSFFITPMYPSAESYAISPDTETLAKISARIREVLPNSVLLCCPEKTEFFATDDFESELLGLLSLHPVEVNAVKNFIRSNIESEILSKLLSSQMIKEIEFSGKKFYTTKAAQLNAI